MSRPRMTPEMADDKARKDFQKEVKHRRVELDITQKDLGEQVGVSAPSMSELLSDPDKLSVGRLRRLVRVLDLDPVTVLRLLGFDTKRMATQPAPAVLPMSIVRR